MSCAVCGQECESLVCAGCLEEGRALLGDPDKQDFGGFYVRSNPLACGECRRRLREHRRLQRRLMDLTPRVGSDWEGLKEMGEIA